VVAVTGPGPVELDGTIAGVTFASEETGFAILRIRPSTGGKELTVVGTLPSPTVGEHLRVWGHWKEHARYGRQLELDRYELTLPATPAGITSYLGSGLVRGIGPRTAERIVDRFGPDTLRVIEEEPQRLREVSGLGAKRIEAIRVAWQEQRGVRAVMIALRSLGVSPALAARVYRRYGEHAPAVLKADPYRLAAEVEGIGFLTADRIASGMGLPGDSPARLEAGLVYTLERLSEEGHVFAPVTELLQEGQKLLDADRAALAQALERASAAARVVVEGEAAYLPALLAAERGVAASLARLASSRRSVRETDAAAAVRWAGERLGLELADRQAEAVRLALESKLLVITGGPGTGKTTILRALLAVTRRLGARVLLAAPTGRSAKRMTEATGAEACTIHRLLEYHPFEGGFRRNRAAPLPCDLLVVDEVSMVDTVLMHHLLAALPDQASLVLVGDSHQLPSVGAGTVLEDIISSGRIPVVELDHIFRQAASSRIVVNAHRIRLGMLPERGAEGGEETDFYFVEQEDPERLAASLLKVVTERIPRRWGLDPVTDVQVLTPMHRGAVGAENLNRLLQEALNPGGSGLERGSTRLKVRDKVIQLKNDYEREVWNGDIGRIVSVDAEARELVVSFEGRSVRYPFAELDALSLAYALTVHKAQGSEYPAVVMPVVTQHYMLLQRNLLYTAVTRGRRLVVLLGSWKALAMAVKNDRPARRSTALAERIRSSLPGR
jgi:exodeoxyribonuclease V alpha subunit